MDRIIIPLDNGYRIVAEQNTGAFNKELFIGIENPSGAYCQDLAFIRPTYSANGSEVKYSSDKFEVAVYGDSESEDYTKIYTIPLVVEENEGQ